MDKPSLFINKEFYPECYIPEKLSNYFEGNIKELIEKNRPKLTEQVPIPPKLPEKPNFNEFVFLIPALIGLLFHFKFFVTVIIVLFLVVTFRYLRIKSLYPYLIENYNSKLSTYETLMKNYIQKEDNLKKKNEKYNLDLTSYRFINSLLAKELKETFESSPKSCVFAQSPRKGRSEINFKKYLSQYFTETIQDDCTIEIFQYSRKIDFEFSNFENENNSIEISNCYVPDFCFIHPTKSLKIDIEIDEPYTYKKPIHFVGSDIRRNKYFIEKNWIVLRFSEQQVLKTPNECCREIAEVIYDFTNDASYINKFLNIGRLSRTKKWTMEDAVNHINIGYRQNYPELKNNVVIKDFINNMWDDDENTFEFAGSYVKRILKQKHLIEKSWKNYKGIFYLTRDKLNRYCINIMWDINHVEYLIIDYLVKGNLTITNMYTRAIYSLSPTNINEKICHNIYYDFNTNHTYSIEEIKQIFGFDKLAFFRIYKIEQKTEYLYFINEEKNVVFTMHQNLFIKLNLEKGYNKIKLEQPRFSKFNERNVIMFDLVDGFAVPK